MGQGSSETLMGSVDVSSVTEVARSTVDKLCDQAWNYLYDVMLIFLSRS